MLLSELYVKPVYLNLFRDGGMKFKKHFKEGTSYKSLVTPAIGATCKVVVGQLNGRIVVH
jgi:hypothetical protein